MPVALTYGCWAQLEPASGGAYEALITVAAATEYIISALHVNNRSSSNDSFSIRVRVGGAGANTAQQLYSSEPILANDAFPVMAGYPIGPSDVLEVASVGGDITFALYGAKRVTS